jgi:hypothetical protein
MLFRYIDKRLNSIKLPGFLIPGCCEILKPVCANEQMVSGRIVGMELFEHRYLAVDRSCMGQDKAFGCLPPYFQAV